MTVINKAQKIFQEANKSNSTITEVIIDWLKNNKITPNECLRGGDSGYTAFVMSIIFDKNLSLEDMYVLTNLGCDIDSAKLLPFVASTSTSTFEALVQVGFNPYSKLNNMSLFYYSSFVLNLALSEHVYINYPESNRHNRFWSFNRSKYRKLINRLNEKKSTNVRREQRDKKLSYIVKEYINS